MCKCINDVYSQLCLQEKATPLARPDRGVGCWGYIPKLRRKPPLMQAGQGMYMQDNTDPDFLLND